MTIKQQFQSHDMNQEVCDSLGFFFRKRMSTNGLPVNQFPKLCLYSISIIVILQGQLTLSINPIECAGHCNVMKQVPTIIVKSIIRTAISGF